MARKKTDKTEEKQSKKKKTGSWCVYFTYKMKGAADAVPQIITYGSEDQCKKHIEDYNRQTLPDNRCQLKLGKSSDILAEITRLKEVYGSVDDEHC
jgi:hypothetical protein